MPLLHRDLGLYQRPCWRWQRMTRITGRSPARGAGAPAERSARPARGNFRRPRELAAEAGSTRLSVGPVARLPDGQAISAGAANMPTPTAWPMPRQRWQISSRSGSCCRAPTHCLEPPAAPSAGDDKAPALLAHFGLTAKALGPRNAQRLDSVARVDDDRLGALFMTAAERSYANGLMPALQRAARSTCSPVPHLMSSWPSASTCARSPSGEFWKQKAIMKPSAMPDFSVYSIALHPFAGAHRAACCRCFSRPVTTFRSVRSPAGKAGRSNR